MSLGLSSVGTTQRPVSCCQKTHVKMLEGRLSFCHVSVCHASSQVRCSVLAMDCRMSGALRQKVDDNGFTGWKLLTEPSNQEASVEGERYPLWDRMFSTYNEPEAVQASIAVSTQHFTRIGSCLQIVVEVIAYLKVSPGMRRPVHESSCTSDCHSSVSLQCSFVRNSPIHVTVTSGRRIASPWSFQDGARVGIRS